MFLFLKKAKTQHKLVKPLSAKGFLVVYRPQN